MPECLLYVLVNACKPVRCRFSMCLEPIGMHCRWSTLELARLRMFSCHKDTSWSFLAILYSELLVAFTKQLHIEWSVTTLSVCVESMCFLLHVVKICCCTHVRVVRMCVIIFGKERTQSRQSLTVLWSHRQCGTWREGDLLSHSSSDLLTLHCSTSIRH